MAFKSDAHRRWWFANRGKGAGAGGSGGSAPSSSAREVTSPAAAAERRQAKDDYFTISTHELSEAAERQRLKEDAAELVRYDGEWMTKEAAQRQREKEEYFAQVMREQDRG